jgi:hypothetical protein
MVASLFLCVQLKMDWQVTGKSNGPVSLDIGFPANAPPSTKRAGASIDRSR